MDPLLPDPSPSLVPFPGLRLRTVHSGPRSYITPTLTHSTPYYHPYSHSTPRLGESTMTVPLSRLLPPKTRILTAQDVGLTS